MSQLKRTKNDVDEISAFCESFSDDCVSSTRQFIEDFDSFSFRLNVILEDPIPIFEKRLKMVDPVTGKGRYGPETSKKVEKMIERVYEMREFFDSKVEKMAIIRGLVDDQEMKDEEARNKEIEEEKMVEEESNSNRILMTQTTVHQEV